MPSRAYQHSHQPHLRSNLCTLLALTFLFLYISWLYRGLRRQAELSKHLPHQLSAQGLELTGHSHSSSAHTPARVAVGNGEAGTDSSEKSKGAVPGKVVGSQLTNDIPGGMLFSWGLDAGYRLGRVGGDAAVPQLTLPHLQVVSVAASRHSLLATAEGAVYSMGPIDSAGGGGHGSKPLPAAGQLGRPTGSTAPGLVTGSLSGQHVVQVVSGRYHSVAVTADGAVYSWGLNDWGQLGRQLPGQSGGGDGAEYEDGNGVKGVTGSATTGHHRLLQEQQGWMHASRHNSSSSSSRARHSTALLGAYGTAGSRQLQQDGKHQQEAFVGDDDADNGCSSGWSCHAYKASKVEALSGFKVVAAAAGRYSTLVCDDAGNLWVWGYDGCAAGALPEREEAWRPRKVEGQLAGKEVVAFDVGYTFWLAATSGGELYTCDSMDDGYAGTLPEKRKPNHAGQLGRSGGNPHVPGRVDKLSFSKVVAVAAGRAHALVATSEGQVFSFGGNRAVLGRAGPHDVPVQVKGQLAGEFVLHVAAGEYFSLAATDSKVYTWGSNAYQCLGNGNTTGELLDPATVDGELGSGDWLIRGIAAGYQHAFAVADKPGDAELAQLREDSKRDAAAATSAAAAAGGVAGVEVVLTDRQKQERQHMQQEQLQHFVAKQSSVSSTSPASQQGGSPQPATITASGGVSQAAAQAGSVKAGSAPSPVAANSSINVITLPGSRGPEAPQSVSMPPRHLHHKPPSSSSSSNSSSICSKQTNISAAAAAAAAQPDYHFSYLPSLSVPVGLPLPRIVWSTWSQDPRPWHAQLVALSGDVFKALPTELNSMHKNPCWGGLGPQLQCLPYFNIIGVSKSGTTDLYNRLTMHKHILAATNKGPHFWDECPFPVSGPCTAGPSGDFQAYINLFSRAADLIRSRPDAVTGEASSNTYTSANGVYLRGFRGDKPWAAWGGAAGVNASMPALLREAQPYLRLIVLFRNPVDRYYSGYQYYRWWEQDKRQPTADDFHGHAVKEMQQWRGCLAAAGVAECVRRYQPQQLVKGMYAEFLQDWLRHFPRQQLLILRYEDYKAALSEHLKAVLYYLDVPEPEASTWAAMTSAAVTNKKQYPPMRHDTRQLLMEFYAPFNKALSEALGGDCRWLWMDADKPGGVEQRV